MKKRFRGCMNAKGFLFAAFLSLVATDLSFAGNMAARPEVQASQIPLPIYGDSSTWGRYFRQLQDTTATSWYKEVTYYGYRFSFSRGVVTARFTVTPGGRILYPQILSNTANDPMGNAVVRALKKTWMQPFPAAVAALAPNGLVVDQTFRLREYDKTNYGWASSYPQMLVRRAPEIGGASNLDVRKFRDLSIFHYQSRIIAASPAGSRQVVSR